VVAAWGPLPFTPYLRPMPWGGQRLASWVGSHHWPIHEPVGEVWLLADHPHHSSVVASGPWAGRSLRELMVEHGPELIGRRGDRFPLLFKLLDARENLSIQVHPDDELARTWAPGEGGKTEAWVVLEADPAAHILLGLKPGVDHAVLKRELATGTLPLCLARYEPRPGQCYFVPAGTVHALGGGTAVFEVQQTSDATFRLYDWGRVDAQGRPRALHLEAGLACIRTQPEGAGLQKPQPLDPGLEQLVASRFFQLRRWTGPLSAEAAGPAVWFAVTGSARLGDTPLSRGTLLLLPAAAPPQPLHLEAETILLETRWES